VTTRARIACAEAKREQGTVWQKITSPYNVSQEEALQNLASSAPQPARIVELRYFGGLTIAETAEVLGVSHATVERDWAFARAWLKKELTKR
jgi:RNA polymerase sigma factor (sigma-70 family)